MTIAAIKERIEKRYQYEPLYKQVLTEFLDSIVPYMETQACDAVDYARLDRLLEPERIIQFKVVWEDDAGRMQHNHGYRVQFNSALGPYKGGLRFDPTVSIDVLKFLGFEQIFKNALTGLPLGGGKGGSDFDPKGKSENEIRRFCVAFMQELSRHIGAYTDVPAGDIGVGGREIGYLYGAYKRFSNRTDGSLTGKGVVYSGSHIRIEATGYGVVYFVKHMLAHNGEDIRGKRFVISGSGNVATHVAKKAIEEGATVLTLSDRRGYLFVEQGFTEAAVDLVIREKEEGKSLADIAVPNALYREGNMWQEVAGDIYTPCATQNELTGADAAAIIEHGALLVAEGANMPLTLEAVHAIQGAGIFFGPSKAVNAGGVAVSGLEMRQNASHVTWTRGEVDAALQEIMENIHTTCIRYGKSEDGSIDYIQGANIGGFVRVFETMRHLGW